MLCSAGSQVFELLFWTSPKTISDHQSISFVAMLLTKLVADHSRPLSPPDAERATASFLPMSRNINKFLYFSINKNNNLQVQFIMPNLVNLQGFIRILCQITKLLDPENHEAWSHNDEPRDEPNV